MTMKKYAVPGLLCAAARERAAYVMAVDDIVEPNPAWREHKRSVTGREWDYDFRQISSQGCRSRSG